MSLIPIVQGGHSTASDFDTTLIGNSVWFDGSADELTRSTTSHSSTEVVMACWFQFTNLAASNKGLMGLGTGTSGSNNSGLWFSTDNGANTVYFYANGQAAYTTQVLRDIGWYHILGSWKLDESGTAKGKLFINGSEVTSFSSDGRGSWGTSFNSTATQSVGSAFDTTMFPGYIAQPIMLDGQSIQGGDVAITDFVDTFTFGANGSQIIPKKNVAALAGAAGGNSFCLDFANSGDLGNDVSGNNKDLTTSMGTDHQSSNTPSLVYPTLNPLAQNSTGVTLSEGNLGVARSSSSQGVVPATMGMTSGKFYCEVTINDSSNFVVGLVEGQLLSTANRYLGQDSNTYGYDAGGQKVTGGSYSSYGTSYTSGDVVSIIFDADAGKLFFGKDGTVQNSGNPVDGTNFAFENLTNGPYFFAASVENVSSANVFNFGTSSFAHTPPTGFVALNSANLTAPTHFGCDYFTPVKYTGNGTAIGSGGKAVTGANLQPDFVWIKNRDASDSHALYDVVRGTTKQAETDTTAIETTEAEGLSTFGSDGFTVGSLAEVNTSSEDFISWNFKAGGSASSNGSGSITSSVSAAAPGHFSIVSWTGNTTAGATVGHGLGGTPEFIIGIARNESGENKPVYHKFMTADTDHLKINENNAQGTAGTTIWDVSAMSSTVIGLGAAAQSNSTNGMIAFCFRSVPGVCKVGSYVGNGNADGPYVVTGFTPSWVMVKPIGASNPWTITDTARDPVNATTRRLHPNLNQAEETDSLTCGDILADGFKVRASHGNVNQSGISFLYVALSQIAGNGTLPPILGR
jgi:hypothetical protein|tara:strand:+ start:3537 stop:5933 length:2397 start_codon:yes stop_codon:yes gene_type:complete